MALALMIAIIGLSVGFAAMSTNLQITGTARMDPANWEVKFANLSTPIITGDATVITAPTLTDTNIGTYQVELTKPGDSITYTFDVTNTGTINARITTFTMPNPTCTGTGTSATADATIVCNNLVYTLTYTANGATVGLNDILPAGQTRNMTLRISYPSTVSVLPNNLVNITDLGITIVYMQD